MHCAALGAGGIAAGWIAGRGEARAALLSRTAVYERAVCNRSVCPVLILPRRSMRTT